MTTNKEKFWLALERAGIDKPKCRFVFKEKGLYGDPEMWIYPKEAGSHGTLVTMETISDIDYLKEYIYDFRYIP
jgi:hypothetical protein